MVLAEMLAPFNFMIMKDILYICIIIVLCVIVSKVVKYSSPVEKVNDDKIVNIVDSILDARFGAGCCYEDNNDSKVE